MGLFKQIWEKDPDKIRRFIGNARSTVPADQRKLAGIALQCADPDLRHAAAKKMSDPSVRALSMKEAREKGDLETVQAIIDGEYYKSICSSMLFSAVVRAGDMESLSLLALRIKSLVEWNNHAKELEPLLRKPGFDDAVSHYNKLKKIEEKEAAAQLRREKKLAEDRKREEEQKKLEEKKRIRKNNLLFYPSKVLSAFADETEERRIWEEYYEYQLEEHSCNILWHVEYELRDLSWFAYFPEGAVRKAVMDSVRNYVSDDGFAAITAERDLNSFLQLLYENREDLHEEILSLSGEEYYAGREGSTVNFGDHHEDWFVTFDPIPEYYLLVSLSENKPEVHLSER